MEENQNKRWVCVQCACHLESSFKFCPKCGLKLAQNKETSARSVGNGQRFLCAKPKQSTQRARLMPMNATVSQPISSASSGTLVQTRLQLPGFSKYKTEKEQERRRLNIRGKEKKRRVEPQHVLISVGIMGENEKPRRSETLPVNVEATATAESIVEAAISKHAAFNKRFNKGRSYRLLYKDGSRVLSIPGTCPPEPFTLLGYKEASGFGWSKIIFYLGMRDVVKDLPHALESDSSSENDYDGIDGVDGTSYLAASQHRDDCQPSTSATRNRSCTESKNSNEKPEILLLVNCPTCHEKYSVAEIEQHADLCADDAVEYPDPFAVFAHNNSSSSVNAKDESESVKSLRNEISILKNMVKSEVIRVTVRCKHLWQDYAKAREKSYHPSHSIKVTFCGESAIDDGGPRREFFSDMISYCRLRLFSNGCPVNSVVALSNEDFRIAGEIMAMSIIQGGPGPYLFSSVVYNIISKNLHVADCKTGFVKETCFKLQEADDNEIQEILMEDKVLDILGTVGYNGVPSRENKNSVKKIIESICLYDQIPEAAMPMILQIMEGLKIYGLLSAMQNHPDIWKPVFVKECMPVTTPTTFLDEVEAIYTDSQLVREKESDVFYNFSAVINSMTNEELQVLFKWVTGSTTMPPLGLPKKIKITFLGGCDERCCCRPTTSTCDLRITIPLHLDTFAKMHEILLSALKESGGFHLL